MFLLNLLASATEFNAHFIAIVVFIVTMLFWLIGGATGVFVGEGTYRRIGGSLVPWLAVASLAFILLG